MTGGGGKEVARRVGELLAGDLGRRGSGAIDGQAGM